MKKHAILLSGGVNFNNNFKRYKNDLEFAYGVLRDDCGFGAEDIKIFYANGICLDYANDKIDSKEANRQNIIHALEEEKNNLNSEDEFVFVVSNHGGSENGGFIYLWGNDTLNLEELYCFLQDISAKKILLMGECYAGNMLRFDITNACVMTANMSGMVSYTNPLKMNYDEFLYHFFSYIHGSYPEGEPLTRPGRNSIKEAFQYAVDMDILSPNSTVGNIIRKKYRDNNMIEIPQIKCDIMEELRL